eukprot:13227174-Heterocapsa_arctica.AAC.1
MELEETEITNITETEMKEVIDGIEKKIEQLVKLHNKSDQMHEELQSIWEIVNIIRGKVAN